MSADQSLCCSSSGIWRVTLLSTSVKSYIMNYWPLSAHTQVLEVQLTDTKKLVVPSALSNIPGKSLSQVSSPYITSLSSRAFS